jgi:hypothetical protein
LNRHHLFKQRIKKINQGYEAMFNHTYYNEDNIKFSLFKV